MPFVPKSPPPPDFCGCPPCPLCFDHVDDAGEELSGFTKMCLDVGGARPAELDPEKYAELERAAESIHAANRAGQVDADLAEATQKRYLEMKLAAARKESERAAARPPPLEAGNTLDELMDAKEIDESDFDPAPAIRGNNWIDVVILDDVGPLLYQERAVRAAIERFLGSSFSIPGDLIGAMFGGAASAGNAGAKLTVTSRDSAGGKATIVADAPVSGSAADMEKYLAEAEKKHGPGLKRSEFRADGATETVVSYADGTTITSVRDSASKLVRCDVMVPNPAFVGGRS